MKYALDRAESHHTITFMTAVASAVELLPHPDAGNGEQGCSGGHPGGKQWRAMQGRSSATTNAKGWSVAPIMGCHGGNDQGSHSPSSDCHCPTRNGSVPKSGGGGGELSGTKWMLESIIKVSNGAAPK